MSKFTLVWKTENGGKTVYLFNTKAEKKAAVKILKGRGGCPVVPASTLNGIERNVEVAPQQTTDEAVAKQPQGISAEELQSLADFFRNPGLVRARKEAEAKAAKAEEDAFYQEVKVQVRKDLAQELLEKQFDEGKLEWQQLIDLYCFIERIPSVRRFISLAAWQTKSVSNYKELGAKSPKLSKVLMHLGLSAKAVSAILSADSKKSVEGSGSWITSSEEDIWDQGNSVHYSSCQATDERASWSGGTSYNEVGGDIPFVEKGELFLWVVGKPMREDGKGFEARAKVRKVYHDRACSILAGLYVDRPYGQHNKLLACLPELEAWWYMEGSGTPIFFPPVWQRDNGAGNDFEGQYGGVNNPLYCPSACGGYQDTLTRAEGPYTFMRAVNNASGSIRNAYSSRVKVGGVYLSESNQTWYNPQSGKFTNPTITLPVKRNWNREDSKYIDRLRELGFTPMGSCSKVEALYPYAKFIVPTYVPEWGGNIEILATFNYMNNSLTVVNNATHEELLSIEWNTFQGYDNPDMPRYTLVRGQGETCDLWNSQGPKYELREIAKSYRYVDESLSARWYYDTPTIKAIVLWNYSRKIVGCPTFCDI